CARRDDYYYGSSYDFDYW
nr:immunoglobulin heavy chain junction region [Mus musculus]